MKTNTVVLVLLAAVGLGLVGGILGGIIIGGDGVDRETADKVSALEARMDELEEMGLGAGPRVSFVDVEGLFMDVFRPQVEAERQVRVQKEQEINQIRQRYAAGELDDEQYQEEYLIGMTRLLQAELALNMTMLDKMLASDGFDAIRADLEDIKQQAEPLAGELDMLLEQARAGVLDPEAYMSHLQSVHTATQQIDQILSQVAAQSIVQ